MRKQQQLNQESLAALAQQFAQWRKNRASRREKIPATLLDQALTLAASLPSKSILLDTLKINHAQLKRHERAKAAHNELPPMPVEFVQLPSQPASAPIAGTPSVAFTRQDGQQMRISGLNMEQLSCLVNDFIQPFAQERP